MPQVQTNAVGVDFSLLNSIPDNLKNPFRPGFSRQPLMLAGRSDEINVFLKALQNGPGSDGSSYVITGARGTGKTVLVNEIANICRQSGYDVFAFSSRKGTLKEFIYALCQSAKSSYEFELNPHIEAFGIGGSIGSIKKTSDNSDVPLTALLKRYCLKSKRGVIIALDEVEEQFADDLVPIIKSYQDLLGDTEHSFNIFLIVSGLPMNISKFEMIPGITFLHRSLHQQLSSLNYTDAMMAIIETCERNGNISINQDNADIIARASCGYPFAIQQFGSNAWDMANSKHSFEISQQDCMTSIKDAYFTFSSLVLDPIFRDMSLVELRIVKEIAMEMNNGNSDIAEIKNVRKSLNYSPQYIGTYRDRLIKEGILTASNAQYGKICFAFPYIPQYVHDNLNKIDCALESNVVHPMRKFIF